MSLLTVLLIVLIVVLILRERIAYSAEHPAVTQVLLIAVALIPVWVFWSLTPAVLVRDGGSGLRYLMLAGLAGVVIDGILIPLGGRLLFPAVITGWNNFGPIGVAMALFTWCGVIGTGWVITACVGAVLWERLAPAETVVEVRQQGATPWTTVGTLANLLKAQGGRS